jgi:hypothetical protein
MLRGLMPADLDRIVDRNWNPPATLGVRLVSVADDCLQHAGQAAYAGHPRRHRPRPRSRPHRSLITGVVDPQT